MSSKELREKATKELAKALGNKNKAINYLDAMDNEVKAQQEVACMLDEMMA